MKDTFIPHQVIKQSNSINDTIQQLRFDLTTKTNELRQTLERHQKATPSQPELAQKIENALTSKLQNFIVSQLDNSEVYS